ncbi:CcdB family protein [Allomesorhizobium camelthorni]|uniref:Toxin CcdB n=1 Tax=Allomesorhizobium camelthorni TaxID=475069 RepID=A0A6G4W6M5_9HYPH|nr:CcdB family protein [Mesorhizobium camelthorni]NGO49820.1 plasmid maintenance protein CcdB [Mesorhizobium camelthorni]
MARYDLFSSVGAEGYLLNVQTDLLDHLKTRVVIPLLPAGTTPPPVKRLNPIFEIGGQKYVLATQLLSAVPVQELTRREDSLSRYHDQIVGALDMLFQGF